MGSGSHSEAKSSDSLWSGNGVLRAVSANAIIRIDILKQQGHFFDLNTLAYSNDGSMLATGGDDGKIKLWTTRNHLCFSTFSEHTGTVTAL